MSAPVMLLPAPDAARLDRLEAAFLRSPSSEWPPVSPATTPTVEPPVHGSFEPPGAPHAWSSKYRTYGFCCKL